MARGGGCRRSLLVDVWGSSKSGRIVVNRERKEKKSIYKRIHI